MAVRAGFLNFEKMGCGSLAVSGPQDWVLGAENGFCFQELHPVPALFHQQGGEDIPPVLQSSCDNHQPSSISCSGSLRMELLQSLAHEFEKQNLEINWFLQLENQRLRAAMHEAVQHQALLLQRHYESRISALMLQKDEELTIARNRAEELQTLARMAEMEAKSWKAKSSEKEALVLDLHNSLTQFRDKEADAVSFCDSSSKLEKTGDGGRGMGCKSCQTRVVCVVFFPCKHLCCCKSCDSLLGHCPVCGTVKETSLEVFLKSQVF